ncbi:MAG TPA: hypothetical protein VGD80_25735 [Kofleriaceae bacterium]
MKQWIAIAVLVMFAGCKQGNGQRCQVNSDCVSNMCSGAEPKVCIGAADNTSDIDATPADAPSDAGPDAPPDAPPDV